MATHIDYQRLAKLFKLFGHPTRLKLFLILCKAGSKGLTQSELSLICNIPPATVYDSLRDLRAYKFVCKDSKTAPLKANLLRTLRFLASTLQG